MHFLRDCLDHARRDHHGLLAALIRPISRTEVVGIFTDDRSLIRRAGMLCIEANDEWLVGRLYLSAESISLVLTGPGAHTDKEIKEEVPELQAA